MTILLVFCPCMLCSNTVPLSPCGGSLCVEKKRTEIGAETRYLMLSNERGDFHAHLKWGFGHFTDNIFSSYPPTQGCSRLAISSWVY